MNIYVGNLAWEVRDEDLRQSFEAYGEVKSARVISDNMTGRSRGFGFVEMADHAQGEKAIEALNNKDLKGRAIKVNEARPRSDEGRGNRRFDNKRW
jgi:RNA recognition motif-containing protein